MKKNCWSIFGMMVGTTLLAQPATNSPPAAPIQTPAPAAIATNATPSTGSTTNAPAKPKKKTIKKATKPAAAELKTVPLVAGPAIVDANHVNVRGQAKLKSEIVTRLNKGDQVTVLEEIVRNNSGPDEPSAWAKILLPTNTHAFVNTKYIDSSNQTVKPKKLNVRSGAGENYSVLGQLQQGDTVKQVNNKGDWLEIEPPANAYAFVAAQFLRQEAPGTPAPIEPMPATTTVAEAPAIAAAPTETPATPPPATTPVTSAPTETPAVTNAPVEMAATPPVEEPPPKRIVLREGVVRGTTSIQAPTHFALYSAQNGRIIDYLYTSSPDLDLRRYKGLGIVVTGEEAMEERWGNTPVITIQKIQVLDEGP